MALRKAAVVTTQWLKQQISSPRNLQVLDSTWGFGKNGREDYLRKHIPGARFFDLDRCVTPTQYIPRNPPDPKCFEEYAQELGINQHDHVVIYDRVGTMPAARAWWQFLYFGHNNVSVLNGGLQKWEKDGNPTSTEENLPDKKGDFKAEVHPELMKTFEAIKQDIQDKSCQILDCRAPEYFKGECDEPSSRTKTALMTANLKEVSNMSRGHIPGAINFEISLIIDPDTGLFYSPDQIKENFHKAGVDLNKPLTTTCYNGLFANILSIGAALNGKMDTALYCGSWTEFGQRASQSDCALGDAKPLRSG